MPSFSVGLDRKTTLADGRTVTYDLAYGGNFYAILPLEQFGLPFDRDPQGRHPRAGLALMDAINAEEEPVHPEDPSIRGCHHVHLYAPGATARHSRHAMAIHPGWFDRSPCGTGTSARMAQLHARGELPLHTEFVNESFIGTQFTGGCSAPPRSPGSRPCCPASPAAPGSPARPSTCSTRRPVPRRIRPLGSGTSMIPVDRMPPMASPRTEEASPMPPPHTPAPALPVLGGKKSSYRERVADALRAALIAGELRPGEVLLRARARRPLRRLGDPGARGHAGPGQGGPGRHRAQQGVPGHRGHREAARRVHPRPLAHRDPDHRRSGPTADPVSLEALRPAAREIVAAAAAGDLIAYVEADTRFHLGLLALAGNAHLVEVVGDLRKRARLYGLTALAESGRLLSSAQEHLELLDALLDRDEAAHAVMTRHLGHVRGMWAAP